MTGSESGYLVSLLSGFDRRLWVLAGGRFASAVGSGFTCFYAPIYFVNVVKISPAHVGIGLGISAVAGFLGRVIGGTIADSPRFGRRRTLLIAACTMALGSFLLAFANGFALFVIANALLGTGIGLYWPAGESLIADITPGERLSEAFGLTRAADYIGLGTGVLAGGLVIGESGAYRALFIVDGVSYVLLFLFVFFGIKETAVHAANTASELLNNWLEAARDREMLLFALMNVLCTSNIIQATTTLPLFLSNFVPSASGKGFSTAVISGLFASYIILMCIFQLPAARLLVAVRRTRAFVLALFLWMAAYLIIWCAGTQPAHNLLLALSGLAVFALANTFYGPSASALFVELAPPKSRAVYLSINSLCWATGGAIAPPIGMSLLGRGDLSAKTFWLWLALINFVTIFGMLGLDRLIKRRLPGTPE